MERWLRSLRRQLVLSMGIKNVKGSKQFDIAQYAKDWWRVKSVEL